MLTLKGPITTRAARRHFSYSSFIFHRTWVLAFRVTRLLGIFSHKNFCGLCEARLLSTHNICFWAEKRKNQKTYLRTCAPSEDSDQTSQMRSLIRIFTGRILDSQGCEIEDSDQTARMRKLIWVFVGRTRQKVRFLTLRLNYMDTTIPSIRRSRLAVFTADHVELFP